MSQPPRLTIRVESGFRSLRGDRLPGQACARRGASMILIMAMLATFAILAAITIDYAYMGLVQSQLRIATDAAAKAGAEALGRTEKLSDARAAAINYAALNTVGGQPFQIRTSDVRFGRINMNEAGRWVFMENESPPNAVRVDGRTGQSALHPAVPLFFGKLIGRETFAPAHSATAGQKEVAVCLCMDRSGSMLFDMSGSEFVYAPDNPLLINFTAWGEVWQNHLSPPNPVGSRWAVLDGAIQLFLDEAERSSPPPRTALVTWGSDYTRPIGPKIVFKAATTDVALPAPLKHDWESNREQITDAVEKLGQQSMMGATNLSAGLDEAVMVLTAATAGAAAEKIIILMTDGEWNEGRPPSEAALEARKAGITVHTVTMLTGYQPDVQEIATITGGRHFTTSNEAELRHAFRELARSLHAVLVD